MSLLSLPPELLTIIYTHMPSPSNVHALSLTCSSLHSTYVTNALTILPNTLSHTIPAAPTALDLVCLQESKTLITDISAAWCRGLPGPQPVHRQRLRQAIKNAKIVAEIADFAVQFGYLDWQWENDCPLHLACEQDHEREKWSWGIYIAWTLVLANKDESREAREKEYREVVENLEGGKRAVLLHIVEWICEGHLWVVKPLLDAQLGIVSEEYRGRITWDTCVSQMRIKHQHKPKMEEAWIQLRDMAQKMYEGPGKTRISGGRVLHAACWIDEMGCQYQRGVRDVWDLDLPGDCVCQFFENEVSDSS